MSDGVFDCIRKEIVRNILVQIQDEIPREEKADTKPEVDSPKVICEVEDILNIPYVSREEIPLLMDIFKPVLPAETELPVIVVIHGGGLVRSVRNLARPYERALASRGYLVFSLEYRLAPRANTCEQLDDVCAGLDLIGRKLVDYNVDFTRMFLTADSAGAFLAIYVTAMKQSKKLQEAIGYEPSRMTFKALGLHSGMFYTDLDDPIGWFMEEQYFGKKTEDEEFLKLLDPEHEEIIKNIPPVFLTTAKGDFLNRYTLKYHEALKKAGRKSRLLYYGDDKLGHSFVNISPYLAESIDAMDKMCDWFEEQAREAIVEQERRKIEQEAIASIDARIENGDLIGLKSWRYIKEINSCSEDRLNAVALIDGHRDYTYRQFFRKWERYAEVFSALDITEENGSRVGMLGTTAVETVTSFYALNMLGVSVSMITDYDFHFIDKMTNLIGKEGVTDLIVPDISIKPSIVQKLMKEKDKLGIRHVILLSIPVGGKFKSEEETIRHKRYKKGYRGISGLLHMDELLKQYEAWPIKYGSEASANAAVIIHTSGTTNGIHKPVPLSDEALNEATARLVRDERFKNLKGRAIAIGFMNMAMSYGMVDGVHLPFAFGGTIVMIPDISLGLHILQAIVSYKVNVMFTGSKTLIALGKLPFKIDLSALEFIFAGGGYISTDMKKKSDKTLRRFGFKPGITIGYGLSEIGAACILSSPDRQDDAMGYPMSGVKVKIYDEDEKVFYNLEDGPRIGVMYLSSRSLSSGYIDDTVFFELDEVEGEKYLNTYDLVRVNEDGSLVYLGRANRYFINNDGVRFDAGLIERGISAEPGIEACGLVPEYNKGLHDTVPILYVTPTVQGRRGVDRVRKALISVFIHDDLFKDSNLPAQCVIAEDLPVNNSGKVDVHKILSDRVEGEKYRIDPIKRDKKLVDIRLVNTAFLQYFDEAGVPEELQEDNDKRVRVYVRGSQNSSNRRDGDEEEFPLLGMIGDVVSWLF